MADSANADAAPVLDLQPDLGFGTASPETAAAGQDAFSAGEKKGDPSPARRQRCSSC